MAFLLRSGMPDLTPFYVEKFNPVVGQPVALAKLGTSITHLYVLNNKNFTSKGNIDTIFITITRVIKYFSK